MKKADKVLLLKVYKELRNKNRVKNEEELSDAAAERDLDAFLNAIGNLLETGNDVSLTGVGVLELRVNPAKAGVMKTKDKEGNAIEVAYDKPDRMKVAFVASSVLNDKVSELSVALWQEQRFGED